LGSFWEILPPPGHNTFPDLLLSFIGQVAKVPDNGLNLARAAQILAAVDTGTVS
jgi:hypothetical protein